jgi:hypothetical protein
MPEMLKKLFVKLYQKPVLSKKNRQHNGQKIPKGGNQNLYIEEEQTTQWSKGKVFSCNFWHRPLILTAGYPKALIPFHVPNNIPSTSTWPVCTRHK